MSAEHRPLLMRANRLLGAQLVENNLVKIEDLESANERLLELVAEGDLRRSSILAVLAYEKKVVREEDILAHLADVEGLGLIDLRGYDIPDDVRTGIDAGACWATWSVPFDREDGIHSVATAYYLSPAVRAHWEKALGGPIIWYGTTLDGIADYLDKLAPSTR